ncbi:MAG: hypothetical protein Hyperionvirus4_78 [Hyperionvirus sp.]|uniref:Uncharacterized protein n=1 Tax=Hyperionvirus sp. TaxID=2487770 RepID=A0A3G5AB96_9VIRU|nr:MAG: hypothetical protein Hyperionvirus4_78 [Hyperionvirus sp.]
MRGSSDRSGATPLREGVDAIASGDLSGSNGTPNITVKFNR